MTTPEGFNTVTPYAIVDGAQEFIRFLLKAFEGKELGRTTADDGKIIHAQVRIGSSTIMISDAGDDYPAMPATYYLYVDDADRVVERAQEQGATLEMEVDDRPYGDRQGGVKDPFGNIWWISQRLEGGPYY